MTMTVSPLTFIPTDDLRNAEYVIDDILDDVLFIKAQSEDKDIAEFREKYVAVLSKVLGGQFDTFEDKGLRGDVDDIMEYAEKTFGKDVVDKLKPETEKYLQSAFRTGQRMKVVPENIQTLWDRPRREAVDWLVDHDRFWIGKVFPEHLSDGFRDTITEGLKQGLGRKDIGRMLRESVMGTPGLPGKQEYYTRIASTSITRANNWGGIFSLHAAGFTEYTIRAVMDERTSAICREMNGKRFSVKESFSLVQDALSGPPSAIEDISPFPKLDRKRGEHYITVGKSKQYLTGKTSSWLAGHGLSLPPYHPSCRSSYVVTEEQEQEHHAVIEPGRPPFNVKDLSPVAMKLDGMHEKKVFQDRQGNRWLFKPVGKNEEFRVWGDRAAADLAERLGIPTPEVYVTEIGGRTGSIQKMFDVAGNFRGINPTTLTRDELSAIQQEHVFDWLISNHDAHPGNMIRMKDGRLAGIDKGQMFRFFGKDKLSIDYNPNPERSLYNDLFSAYTDGKDVNLLSPSHSDLKSLLKKIKDIPDDEFKQILSPYAKRAAASGRLAYDTEEEFFKQVLKRKNDIDREVTNFYNRLRRTRQKVLGTLPKKKAGVFREIDAAFMKKVKESGGLGQSMFVAGDDFENMNLLVYQVKGKGMFLEGKLRAGSQSKLLQRLGIDAGIAEPDEYWDRVLKMAKSYNHHLGPGGDGEIPDHTADLWDRLMKDLKSDKSGKAKQYRKYVSSLASKRGRKISWSKKALGKKIEQYVPPQKKLSGKLAPYTVQTTKGWDYKKSVKHGEVHLAAGKRSFAGTGYDVDLKDGVKLHFIQHGDNNKYSKFGKIRIEIKDDSPSGIRKALKKLGDLGMDSGLATKEDMELLYLSKVSYAAGVGDDIKITPSMSVRQRIKAYRNYWEKNLRVRDITKVKSYSPVPRFDEDRGWGRWTRFDIDPGKFEKEMKGYTLGHNFHGSRTKVINEILGSGGALEATEEKYRIGLPISGMSPIADQSSGGASYVFTRVAGPRTGRQFDVIFSKDLLLDPDTISYNSDYYGRVEPGFIASHRKRTIEDWKKLTGSGNNETLIRNNLPLAEYLERINAGSESERQSIIRSFHKHGITKMRGKKIEDIVKVR